MANGIGGDIDRLVAEQHGMVSTAQLRAAGVTRGQTRWRVDRGVWRPVLRGVLTVTTGPLTREALREAALLAAGGGSALSHHTAAEVWGFDEAIVGREEQLHVTKAIGRSGRRRPPGEVTRPTRPFGPSLVEGTALHPGVVVHRSKAIRNIVVRADQPVVSSSDTVIDLAAGAASAREAHSLVLRLCTTRPVRLDEVRRRVELRTPWRHVEPIRQALETVAGGVASVLEADFVILVEKPFGLPAPTRQVPVTVDGVVRYEDLVYDCPGGRLIVRLDGKRFHLAGETRFRDRRRDNAAQLSGDARLVYGWEDIHAEAAGVAGEILEMLAHLGWAAGDDAA